MRNLLAISAAICGLAWGAAMADEPLRVGPPGVQSPADLDQRHRQHGHHHDGEQHAEQDERVVRAHRPPNPSVSAFM